MDAAFWHQRWQAGQIGFHQDAPTPLLLRHWPTLQVPAGGKVFVPLAGKSQDMAWFAAQGHPVLGVELSQRAVDAFFAEHGRVPDVVNTRYGVHHRAGGIELIRGDAFALDAALLADCAAVFDRGALVALPPDLRRRYASELYARLPRGCRGLLVTLEYPQPERAGPPFSVDATEVQSLFAGDWDIAQVDHRPIPPGHPGALPGLSRFDTAVYLLRRR